MSKKIICANCNQELRQDWKGKTMSKKPKRINCKYCGMGHQPNSKGYHMLPAGVISNKIARVECAYKKAGQVSPISSRYPL